MIYEEFKSRCQNNKYQRWYWNIIDRARARQWTRRSVSFPLESHHAVPKSIIENEETRVFLTVKEHFICHLLLLKFTRGRDRMKMTYAMRFMMNLPQYDREKMTSLLYERVRRDHRKAVVETHTGLKRSDATRQKQRDAKAKGFTPWNKGKTDTHQKGHKKTLVTCPRCGKTGGKPVMYRYHFDLCRWGADGAL